MLKTLQKSKDQKGFTIIEVLIVLAIAGLILLIVFLAVPALQRNSRDTSRRNDISRTLGAAQEVLNNNTGSVSALTSAALQSAVGNLGYYTSTNVTVAAYSASLTLPDTDHAIVVTAATCSGNALASGTSRQLAVLYKVESGGGTAQCTAS
jgi:prepilin-type N-terminal cleavage/methylation domain-containing protein